METGRSYIRYSEMFAKCKIAKCTANYLACIKQLHDLSNSFYDVLEAVYGEKAEELIEDYNQKKGELEDIMFHFLQDSINENIVSNEVSEI